ncbi:sugar ABC transporter substrate-binding protein [Nocardioides koreensis]|uniref:Sugar ABC transporter substrate-binding protein n=1 Tax=Nocardioides koreensis TaxID=433651 RepID=A0ABN2ZJG6_9ACTN
MAATATAAALVLALAGCDSGGAEPGPILRSGSASPEPRTALTFGVFGPEEEVSAFQGVVDNFNASAEDSEVRLRSWDDHDAMMADLRGQDGSAAKLPDVFMVSRADLAWLQEKQLNQPVDELLDERGVDFGDGYSRDALEAFSSDNRLQCMPYAISPMVIYLNKKLVDFTRMQKREISAPDPESDNPHWNFDQFTAAAQFATRPRKGTRGVYIDPTLTGLAPFIYSGGGQVFDDEEDPTSLAFSSEETRSALERTLQLLRDPHVTPTQQQLAKASALTWFERGRLGMIAGFRSLVPELRQVQGLDFDVMPMPSLDGGATVGDITGLCLSADAASSSAAADFLVHALSTEAVSRVVRSGYLVPANLEVAASDDFRQPGRLPNHSAVFSTSVRTLRVPPLIDTMPELEKAVSGSLDDLLNVPVLDLEAVTDKIDEESQPVLDPEGATEDAQ